MRVPHFALAWLPTGKSSLIETMALQDLESGNCFALIDPHGDLASRIAAHVPSSQRDNVIYLNATDPTQPYGYNPLRHVSNDRIALAASGILRGCFFSAKAAGACAGAIVKSPKCERCDETLLGM